MRVADNIVLQAWGWGAWPSRGDQYNKGDKAGSEIYLLNYIMNCHKINI
jgi:hypothetical protein